MLLLMDLKMYIYRVVNAIIPVEKISQNSERKRLSLKKCKIMVRENERKGAIKI